jgi:hypothetical protein
MYKRIVKVVEKECMRATEGERKKGESMAENMKGRGKNMKVFCSRKYEKVCTVCRKGGPGPCSLLAPSPSLNSQGK